MQQQYASSVRWEWISEAWNLFTKQWSVWVLMILVMYLIMFVVYLAVYLPFMGAIMMSATTASEISAPAGSGIFLMMLLATLVINVVALWLYGGLYNAAFKQLRGEQITVGNLFSGGKYLTRMLGIALPFTIGYAIIYMISPVLNLLLFIAALILLGPALFIFPMIVEGGKGPIDALKASIEVAKREWIMFTFFFIVLCLIAFAGAFACGIGVLATAPLLFLGQALAYRDCVGMAGVSSEGQFMPPPPPPDYRSYTPSYLQSSSPQAQPLAEAPHGASPQHESTPKTCPHCGATLARVMNFCNQCGHPLKSA